MSAAAAPITGASGRRFTNMTRNDPTDSGRLQAQCTPIHLPALGTQMIIQGNGTNVGTVISLQCPAKHKLVGSELKCIMDTNSTHWVGETYCKPLSPYEEYGFRVALLASIVSSAIIILLSVAFITCCLLDYLKEDKKKREERELEVGQWEEDAQYQQDNRSRNTHKGRNNNNNTQERALSLWDACNSAVCDDSRVCRCHQQYPHGAAHALPLLSPLPAHEYQQPLPRPNPEPEQTPHPPPQSSCQTVRPGVGHTSGARPGLVWQYEGQQSGWSTTEEPNTRKTNPAKAFSIRIISV